MLRNLENFNHKSFASYSADDVFDMKNLIFGYNGSGKSSLAEGIYNLISDKEKVRYFSKVYIEKNLILENDENRLNGVKATFSEKNVVNLKDLKNLEENIIDVSNDLDNALMYREQVRSRIDEIHDSKKGNLNIKKKQTKFLVKEGIYKDNDYHDIDSLLNAYQNDLQRAQVIENDNDSLKNFNGNSNFYEQYERVADFALPIVNIPEYSSESIAKIKKIFLKEYVEDEIPTSEVINWIQSGLEIHTENDTKCKFCQSSISSIHNIRERVNAYLKNEKQKDESFLLEVSQEIKEGIKQLQNANKNKVNYEFYLSKEFLDANLNFDMEIEKFSNLVSQIALKISNPSKKFNVSEETYDDYHNARISINEKIKNLKVSKKKISDDLLNKSQNEEILVKGSIGLAIKEDGLLNDKVQETTHLEEKIKKIVEKNEDIELKIKEIEESSHSYNDFKDFLNDVLTSIPLNLKLVLDNDNNCYYIELPNKNHSLSINDISEGEYNLLALLFFYFEMFEDMNQDTLKKEIDFIIIDDPVSSFDDHNRFYVLELMKSIMDLENTQVFLLTHSWSDFCDITYGKEKEKENNLKMIEVLKVVCQQYSRQFL